MMEISFATVLGLFSPFVFAKLVKVKLFGVTWLVAFFDQRLDGKRKREGLVYANVPWVWLHSQ